MKKKWKYGDSLYGKLLQKLIVMKVLIIFLFICSVNVRGSSVYSQQKKMDVSMTNVSVIDVFRHVREVGNYTFMYNSDALNRLRPLTIDLKDATIEQIMDYCLKGTSFSYVVDDKVVIIREQLDVNGQQKSTRVKGFVYDVHKQPLPGVTVKVTGVALGTATDTRGWFALDLPIAEGSLEFSFIGFKAQKLAFSSKSDTLRVILEEELKELEEVVSLGYYNMDKRKSTSSITSLKMDDIMQPGVGTLDQMLEGQVPGMIFMQNSGQVGAATRLKIRGTTTLLGSTEPLWVLDGVILQNPVNVDPGKINDLDFVNLLGNAISGLNPSDIEQIDVLKDASATAIYGPKASNGVIVITTKKGKVGKPSVTYNLSTTFRQRPRYTDRAVNVMNSKERIAYSREVIQAGWLVPQLTAWVGYEAAYSDYMNNLLTYDEFKYKVGVMEKANTDWLGILLQDTYSHNHAVNISGGTENLRYYASVGYMDEKGNIKNEESERYTAMVNLNLNYGKFNAQFSLNGNVQKKNYTPQGVGVADYAYNTSRSIPLYDGQGELYFYDREPTGQYVSDFNVVNEMKNSYNKINTNQTSVAIALGYNITSWLKADMNFSYNISNTDDDTWYGEDSFHALQKRFISKGKEGMLYKKGEQNISMAEIIRGGELSMSDTKNENYSLRGSLTFNKMLTDEQSLSAVLIGELSSSVYDGFSITRRNYLADRGMLIDKWDTKTQYTAFNDWLTSEEARGKLTHSLTRQIGAIASVSWAWKNTYILNGNMRMDWSNRFGSRSNEKFLPIWSVSGRWNLNENVVYGVSWINSLALKVSYGFQGNMSEAESPKLIVKRGLTVLPFNEFGSSIKNFPNPILKWEKTSNLNLSVDFALFNNKLIGNLGYYYRHTSDAFLQKTVSLFNGCTSYTVNAGELVNQGFEFNFQFFPINNMLSSVASSGERRGFRWRIDPQLGSVFNQLLDKVKPKDKVLQDEITIENYLTGAVRVAGRPVNTFFSYRFKGLNHDTGAPEFYGTEQYFHKTDEAGNLMYDASGAPVMESWANVYNKMDKEDVWTSRVLTRSGCREPFLQGSINNTFEYNNWVLSFSLTYSLGAKVRLFSMYGNGASIPAPEKNMRRDWIKRWRVPGDEKHTSIPGLVGGEAYKNMNNPWWSVSSQYPWTWSTDVWMMYDNSDIRVASSDYLKLSSLQLRYVVPNAFCKKLCLNSAYLAVSGTNLYTLCNKKLKGQDPSQSGTTDLINISVRPTYSLTLNVTF